MGGWRTGAGETRRSRAAFIRERSRAAGTCGKTVLRHLLTRMRDLGIDVCVAIEGGPGGGGGDRETRRSAGAGRV